MWRSAVHTYGKDAIETRVLAARFGFEPILNLPTHKPSTALDTIALHFSLPRHVVADTLIRVLRQVPMVADEHPLEVYDSFCLALLSP